MKTPSKIPYLFEIWSEDPTLKYLIYLVIDSNHSGFFCSKGIDMYFMGKMQELAVTAILASKKYFIFFS